ncbi:hypothetical protein HDV03_002442, partial [Kappamyces sp. JEL0829]
MKRANEGEKTGAEMKADKSLTKKQKRLKNQEMAIAERDNRSSEKSSDQQPQLPAQSSTAKRQPAAVAVPRHILVTRTIQDREFEIRSMETAIANATEHTGSLRVFQT